MSERGGKTRECIASIREKLSPVGSRLKKIFLKPKREEVHPNPDIESFEDLLEPVEPRIVTPKVVVPRAGIMDRLRANRLFVLMREKQTIIETGMTTRQRVKRYNAMMEGGHGVPAQTRKK